MSELEMPGNDPYAPPVAGWLPVTVSGHEVRVVVVAWERLRIVYNLVLLVAGLGVGSIWGIVVGSTEFLLGAAVVGIGANGCFFAGPLVELYLMAIRRSGPWKRPARWALFGSGLGFSLLMFSLTLLGR
jgi:hypothetical protein